MENKFEAHTRVGRKGVALHSFAKANGDLHVW